MERPIAWDLDVKRSSPESFLATIHPFQFLRPEDRRRVAAQLRSADYAAGDVLFAEHDTDDAVYLLQDGIVDILDRKLADARVIVTVHALQYLGEWETIFHQPRAYSARARTPIRASILSGNDFRALLHASPSFAQAFGSIIRDQQGMFRAFDRFKDELRRSAATGPIVLQRLIPRYLDLTPALHPHASSDKRIDFGALAYAVRRLPSNIATTFALLLVDELPAMYHDIERGLTPVVTEARRRDVWEILPGKDLVVLRPGESDLIDLVSCLCLYCVEARKLRLRIAHRIALDDVDRLAERERSREDHGDTARLADLRGRLPFSSRELAALDALWPGVAATQLAHIARHREMFTVEVLRQSNDYRVRRDELWTKQIAAVTRRVAGCDPSDLPPERGVHIVSSNRHSIRNCLNPWFIERADAIRSWVETDLPHLAAEPWRDPLDLVYAAGRDYLRANPAEAAAHDESARANGQYTASHTAGTGIEVQLIDLAAVRAVDPAVRLPAQSDDIIVNIDYAFGQQAQAVLRTLLVLFGPSIRSLSFFGKAGALRGNRGDLLVPTAFVEQAGDLFQPLSVGNAPDLVESFPPERVQRGPMLTVDGTLLQNRRMLNFYRHIWGAIGMEMEGSYYFRQVVESSQIGVIASEVPARFVYYVSDLPLQSGDTLSAPLAASEGVPPLYAITRSVLNTILAGGAT